MGPRYSLLSWYTLSSPAGVAESVDALRSGRSGVPPRVGSSPTFGTVSDQAVRLQPDGLLRLPSPACSAGACFPKAPLCGRPAPALQSLCATRLNTACRRIHKPLQLACELFH